MNIFRWIASLWRKPPVPSPMEALEYAVDDINEAWANAPKGYSIWIDWQERKVTITKWASKRRYP